MVETNFRAAIFDFNGTLSDDEPILFRIFAELFQEHLSFELTRADYIDRFAGLSDLEIIEIAIAERMAVASQTEREAMTGLLLTNRKTRYRDIVALECPITPDTQDLVRLLASRGIQLAIVTGAQRHDVDLVLSHSPIPQAFPIVVAVEDVARGKPDAEGFLLAAKALGCDPSQIVVFEDSIVGIRAATSAGMRCVAVQGTFDESTLRKETDLVVEYLSAAVVNLW